MGTPRRCGSVRSANYTVLSGMASLTGKTGKAGAGKRVDRGNLQRTQGYPNGIVRRRSFLRSAACA